MDNDGDIFVCVKKTFLMVNDCLGLDDDALL